VDTTEENLHSNLAVRVVHEFVLPSSLAEFNKNLTLCNATTCDNCE
jgi:hypothetical protein